MGKAPLLLCHHCHVWREGRSGRYANLCHRYGYEHGSARTYLYLWYSLSMVEQGNRGEPSFRASRA